MGEETDIAEPMSSDDVVAAENVPATEPKKEHRRKRKKHLLKNLQDLMEFYLGDVNLSKDRFMSQHIQGQPFVYVDLSIFLKFNKVRALTSRVEDLIEALSQSEILQLSDDKTSVCRKTPIKKKENEDDCTIYVEQLPPDIDHDSLTKMFSEYGPVDYISLPRFPHNSKFKGFAFVEFKNPQSARHALEAFKVKGCCLSPHMAPEELMSIKNFDRNNENSKITDNAECKQNNECKIAEGTEVKCLERGGHEVENVDAVKQRKKRKNNGGNEKVVKKLKKDNLTDIPNSALKKNSESENDNLSNNEVENRIKIEIKKSASKHISDKQGESKTAEHSKKQKRKHSEQSQSTLDRIDDKSEPRAKKLKSNAGAGSEASQSEDERVEDGPSKQKKKRKKKKKVKKDKSNAIALGFKVLPKREWKALRNKYLNMQRDMMGSLKQHLSSSRAERAKPEGEVAKLTPQPGTVVKVTLDQPVTNAPSAKSELRVHPDIRYVDVTEGSPVVYLRAATPQLAASLIQAHHWPLMDIIQGEEETEYWRKINLDREEKLRKNKPNQRGRTKLLKRAEQFHGKLISKCES